MCYQARTIHEACHRGLVSVILCAALNYMYRNYGGLHRRTAESIIATRSVLCTYLGVAVNEPPTENDLWNRNIIF